MEEIDFLTFAFFSLVLPKIGLLGRSLSSGLSSVDGGALRVGNAGNADEGEALEVGAVGGKGLAGNGERTLVVKTQGGALGVLGRGVRSSVGEGEDLSLLLARADLDADSSAVSESRNLVRLNVQHIVGLSSERSTNVVTSSTTERVVLAGHLPDDLGSGEGQRSVVVVNLSSHFGSSTIHSIN